MHFYNTHDVGQIAPLVRSSLISRRLRLEPFNSIHDVAEEATHGETGIKVGLSARSGAHQHLVNIGEELRTLYMAGQQPEDDEMLRYLQAYDALLAAARNRCVAVYDEQVMATRKRAA